MAQTVFHGSLLQSGSVPTTALGSGVVSSSVQMTTLLPVGIVSSSAQLPSGTVSGSGQVTTLLPVGIVSSSAQLPAGTVSGSAQVDYNSITNKLSGVVSASGQVTTLLPGGSVSSSAQVTLLLPAGTVSSSVGGGGGGAFVTASNPTLTVNATTTGSFWANSASGQLYVNTVNTTNANEWINLSTGSNVALGNATYSYVTGSRTSILSGSTTTLVVYLKDRYNKALDFNTGQTVTITGSSGIYGAMTYSASGAYTGTVTGPNAITGSITITASIAGTNSPITLTCNIVEPKQLFAIGQPRSGSLLTGSITNATPVINGAGGPQIVSSAYTWESASCGTGFCLATTYDGILYGWGNNREGQLGVGHVTSSATAINIGTGSMSSSLWNTFSAGHDHACATRADGTLWCWGFNSNGQLGDATTTNRNTPTQIGTGTTWAAVSAGYQYTLAVKTDGTLWSWGLNTYGQLGVGNTTTQNTPTQVGTGTTWGPRIFAANYNTAVQCVNNTSFAIKTDGTLWGWGANNTYQIGDNTTTQRTSPVQSADVTTTWTQIASGNGMLGIKSDGILWAWGSIGNYISNRTTGQLTTPTVDSYIENLDSVTQLFYGPNSNNMAFGITRNRALVGWGNFTVATASMAMGYYPSASIRSAYHNTNNYNYVTAGKLYTASSNYNWKQLVPHAVSASSTFGYIGLSGKLSGSAYPSASGTPSSLSWPSTTTANPNYLTWTNADTTAEIQISGSYPNATGSGFIVYVPPGRTSWYYTPPKYSTGITHTVQYIKNGILSATTASVSAQYCQSSGTVLSNTCSGATYVTTTANGSCGSSVSNNTCNYSNCYNYYNLTATTTISCADAGCSGGNYTQYTYSYSGCSNAYEDNHLDVCSC